MAALFAEVLAPTDEALQTVLHKIITQVGASRGLSLLKEGGGVLLHQAAQRGLSRAVALAVNRGTIGRAAGLPVDGWHMRLPRL